MEKNEQEILSLVTDATIQQPIPVGVDILPTNRIHERLQKWGICKRKRSFVIKPIVLGNLIRISKLFIAVGAKSFDLKNVLNSLYELAGSHGEKMAEILAIALQNTEGEPSKKLVKFILKNFTPDEMLKVLSVVLRQMNVTSFMNSIILIRGLNVLESGNGVSLNKTGETIAPGI